MSAVSTPSLWGYGLGGGGGGEDDISDYCALSIQKNVFGLFGE